MSAPPAQPSQPLEPVFPHPVDPLSQVLEMLKLESISSGGFLLPADASLSFPRHTGVKCYAMLAGDCWLAVEGVPQPVLLRTGDCFILPRGLPFLLTTDLSLKPLDYREALASLRVANTQPAAAPGARQMAGGFFRFNGTHAELLLRSLPPVVHIQRAEDRAAMMWSLERMREELREVKPGGALLAQQLAYSMLIQALRLHLCDAENRTPGWLAALSDRQMSRAISSMHNDPGRAWTLQSLAEEVGMSRSAFALRFRELVGDTPMEYLTRWRMLLAADRLKHSGEAVASIAPSLGYESESAFGKAFRRVMGCSPRRHGRTVAAASGA